MVTLLTMHIYTIFECFVEALTMAMVMFVAMEWLRSEFFFVGLVLTMGLYW